MSTCPRCRSRRIKRGYRRTPWWSVVIGRYYLLCDACNWEFVGLAIPGTVSASSRKRVQSTADDIKFSPPEFAAPDEFAETAQLGENVLQSEIIEPEAAQTAADDDGVFVAGKIVSIDNVLNGKLETNRRRNGWRNYKKRRGRVKMKK